MSGIILGRECAPRPSFGFGTTAQDATGDLIHYDGEAPITIIAPTGSGKGRDFIVPTCLTYPGPLFAIDIKGELSAICSRRRREMGHQVAVIDPFSVTGNPSDRLDPFELFELPGASLEADAEMLATLLGVGHGSTREPFWPDTANGLNTGLIAMAAALRPEEGNGFDFVRDHLFDDDTVYKIADLLEKQPRTNRFAYRELAAFLEHADNQTRPSVLSTARTYMRALNSPPVAACLQNPTIHLIDVMEGKPLDIFLVIPPDKLTSHAGLLRLMVGTVLTTIMRRASAPPRKTLFLADECGQLGENFEPILTATTLLRGYGLQLVTVFQDMMQLKSRYKDDWGTILNNSGAVLSFGQGHYAACRDAAEYMGMEASELMQMRPQDAALAVRGDGVRKITRVSYLDDRMFAGMADKNPRYCRPMGR